jgi:hypothetical protein
MGLVSEPEAKPETSRGYCMNISYREFFKKQKHFILTVAKLPVSNDTLGMVSAIIMPALIGIIGIKTYKILFALWPVTRSTLGWEPPTLFEGIRIFLVSPLAFLAVAYLAAYFVLWQRLSIRRWLRAILLFLLPLIALPLAKVLWTGIKGENLTGIESSWAYQIVHVYGDALSDIQFLSGIYRTDIFFLVGYGLLSILALSVVPNRWRAIVNCGV